MPKTYILSNGKTVTKPKSYVWVYVSIVLILIFLSFLFIPVNLLGNFDFFAKRLASYFTPAPGRDWNHFFSYIGDELFLRYLFETLEIAFVAATVGTLLALPVAFVASRNMIKIEWINNTVKIVLGFFRTFPMTVIAVLVAAAIGNGVTAGIVAMTIFSFTILTKMLYESIETVDMTPVEALDATGANKPQMIVSAVYPQIKPILVSYYIYIFELNIRASVVLGIIGVGGLGLIIDWNKGALEVNTNYRVGVAVIVLIIMILIINLISNAVRRKLQ